MTCSIEHTFPTSYTICTLYTFVLINNVMAYYMILILYILALIFKKKKCVSDQFPSKGSKVPFGFREGVKNIERGGPSNF